jgi:hypothetical protein
MECEVKETKLLIGCMNQNIKSKSGTVVLSYGWKNTAATADGVMEKCIVFTRY